MRLTATAALRLAHITSRALLPAALIALCAPAPVQAQTVGEAFVNLFRSARLYVDPTSRAKQQANSWRRSRPADAALMDKLAAQPLAKWVGSWNLNIGQDVADAAARITGAQALPVFVAYNIPHRDCGSYSAGGASSAAAYRKWIRDFAAGLGTKKAVVILEPDAIAGIDCLDAGTQAERYDLIHDAVRVLRAKGAAVYIDAGHARWVPATGMAGRLQRAGIAEANGFSLNISNFLGNTVSIAYGTDLSRRIGGKHFVIDTSRNGRNASTAGNWCNPPGQLVGSAPTTNTGNSLVDAFLWIKTPGESDGTCNGGPPAGNWWAEYALGLAGGSVSGR